MTFSRMIRSFGVGASLAVLGLLAACSKSSQPAASAAPSNGTATAPAPLAQVPAAGSPEERIITQARAAIGPENKLLAIDSMLLSGQMFDDKNNQTGTFMLLVKKPASQRTEQHLPDQTIFQGSDGVMGWALDVNKDGAKRFAVLKGEDEAQNNYETMENLYFYRATERVNGSSVHYEGDEDYRGAKCHKVSFNYPNGISYVRYFDAASGQLRGTVLLPSGNEAVEEGTLTVDGVNFAAVLKNYSKDGKLLQVLKFDKVLINPTIDAKTKPFDMPDMVSLSKLTVVKQTGTGKPINAATGAPRPALVPPVGTAPAGNSAPQPFLPQPLLPSKN